jgi:hypothetical protein
VYNTKPTPSQDSVDPIAFGALSVPRGAARGEIMMPRVFIMSATMLKPKMILLNGVRRPFSARMIIMLMVVEAMNDMEAIEVLSICAASNSIVRDHFIFRNCGLQGYL